MTATKMKPMFADQKVRNAIPRVAVYAERRVGGPILHFYVLKGVKAPAKLQCARLAAVRLLPKGHREIRRRRGGYVLGRIGYTVSENGTASTLEYEPREDVRELLELIGTEVMKRDYGVKRVIPSRRLNKGEEPIPIGEWQLALGKAYRKRSAAGKAKKREGRPLLGMP